MSLTTCQRILPVLQDIYGETTMTQELAEHLAQKIDTFQEDDPDRPLEEMILQTCWNWYAGGGTAAIAARRAMETLEEETPCPQKTPGCGRTNCSPRPGGSCYGPNAPRHIDMED